MTVSMAAGAVLKIDYTDSSGGSGSIGFSDGSEVAEPAWDFGGACATGYAVAIADPGGFSLLKVEADDATALFEALVCTTTDIATDKAIVESIPATGTVDVTLATSSYASAA